ncbi:MAG: Uma2 family endonuclease [Anaerolineae bacterium]|nr:Uma2 family endonuclease [Anaerolineae bacterium]
MDTTPVLPAPAPADPAPMPADPVPAPADPAPAPAEPASALAALLARTDLTGADLLSLEASHPDQRFELLDGQLKALPVPGLEHSLIEANILFLLKLYQRTQPGGLVFTGEVGFYLKQPDRVRLADIAFIARDRLPEKLPVVEIVSPANTAEALEEKIDEWLTFGVRLVWVVYPRRQRVHVYAAGQQPVILNATDALDGGAVLPGFRVTIADLFARA